MAESHVLSALVVKRSEVSGSIADLERKVAQQRADLVHVDAVLCESAPSFHADRCVKPLFRLVSWGAPLEPIYNDADSNAFLARSDGERHQFRLIIAAEDGAKFADLKPFIRDLMAKMEEDLGIKLDWVAVDHHNTGHAHTHVVNRGRDENSRDLVIAKSISATASAPRHGAW